MEMKKQSTSKIWRQNLHENLVPRWEEVLASGLLNDDRNKIISKYPTPENFQNRTALKLNPVLEKPCLLLIYHGGRLAKLQSQVAASLAAIGQECSMTLFEEEREVIGNT
ncbi:hypothetical protein NQ314_014889 [Rhamnusium bicolor]|uniref:Uncharacterized protein n=1 Tax=Rhamnusium bicolor TaxID=1586634 RepID=A0AAV8WZU1_9CUCU|nr:hypothetical protein NQ314_014889 [Rhamnusium bicolor]